MLLSTELGEKSLKVELNDELTILSKSGLYILIPHPSFSDLQTLALGRSSLACHGVVIKAVAKQ